MGPVHECRTRLLVGSSLMDKPKGLEIWHVTCRGCRRTVLYRDAGNAPVGQQERMVCAECGHRGADLLRVYHQQPLPEGVRVWAASRE